MKRRNQIAVPIAAAVGSLVAAAGWVVGPTAHAQPVSTSVTVIQRTAVSGQARAKIADYWTPARMRAAKPLKVRPGAGWKPRPVAAGNPSVIMGTTQQPNASSATNLGGPWTNGGKVVKTTGKVFMTLRGVNYVCSGSVVPAANKSLVTTAGHCVNEGPGAFVTNFTFVPGYKDGSAPYGKWAASSVATTRQWAKQGDFNYDVGFAIVGRRSGKYLTSVVGSQGIGFNQPRARQTYAFGYPAEAPYNGTRLDYSSGVTGNDLVGGSKDIRLRSNMTGGCSGGPWLAKFTPSTGVGTQVSVSSFSYVGHNNALYGPYFGSVIQTAYRQLQSAA